MPKKKKLLPLPFSYRLILNQWIIKQCGFTPLPTPKKGQTSFNPLKEIADILRDCQEGMNADNLHCFYVSLDNRWSNDKAQISRDDLLRYEHNIVKHSQQINQYRDKAIVWKYFQWLSLLFAEIYLDKYFNNKDSLLESLNDYVKYFNQYWQELGYEAEVEKYAIDDLNKICLQNATGSGKTLLMHINFLQFKHYTAKHNRADKFTRTILITPNENLSEQHSRELFTSRINAERLKKNADIFTPKGFNGLHSIDYTEITKLTDEVGPNLIEVRSIGDQNLLLVDEGHRGMGSKEENGWFKNRERLVERGFVFEYSATFKEAINATTNDKIKSAYSKNILFDYSYRYFYADGYGKDYRIFNLPKSDEQIESHYLMACLLAFYQQLKLYKDKEFIYRPFNLEKPLWVFVGKSVSKAATTNDDIRTISDVALILKFISKLLKDKASSTKVIERIITRNAKDTGLVDDQGNDIFLGTFNYIKHLMLHKGWNAEELVSDMFSIVFLSHNGGRLSLAKVKGDDSEIMLRVGQEAVPFGLINVGDATSLINHIKSIKEENPKTLSNIDVVESEFSSTQFKQVHNSSSPITILLGSKKFVEGWDCWRVSTLGLMHVGKKEGAQIIQLFGRGVRLKGHGLKLKRSSALELQSNPKYIEYLETLNIFGIQADFMDKFKKFIKDEELPSNDQKEVYEIPIKFNHKFSSNLKVLRPKIKKSDGEEYDFKSDGVIPSIGELPGLMTSDLIQIDWYPRIQALKSQKDINDATAEGFIHDNKHEATFLAKHLCFLDYDELFFALEKFKDERSWYNLNISKEEIIKLLQDSSWYEILAPYQNMEHSNASNIEIWQQMANELLRKYCEKLYKFRKMEFSETRLELRDLTKKDHNIPQETKYQILVNSDEEELINDIQSMKTQVIGSKDDIIHSGYFKALLFGAHLYQPLISFSGDNKIKINPGTINKSEMAFVEGLITYLKNTNNTDGDKYYLLRNQSRGKGMGFFEAGNFYPDFILWKITQENQYITFVEPHGLMREGSGSDKVKFHKKIKDIQRRLSPDNIKLASFIVTTTRHAELKSDKNIEEWKAMNTLFMNDNDDYISDMMSKIEAE